MLELRASSGPIRRYWLVVAVACATALSGCADSNESSTESVDATTTALDGECAQVHEGHSAMMWTPVMADEMTDADCGWPYEPFDVDLSGGEDDPALDAVFEARHYAELWDAIGAAGLALCSVGAEAAATEQTSVGWAFGFLYQLAAPGCPDAVPTGSLRVDEFGTEAQRDAAALASADDTATFVLGRWVIGLDGAAEGLEPELVSLGAQPVR